MDAYTAGWAGGANHPTRLAGHIFSNIVASDQSRIHNGDFIDNRQHFYFYNYYCAESPSRLPIPQPGQPGSSSLKRKRYCNDGERLHRSNDHIMLEEAINKLGKLSDSVTGSRDGERAAKVARKIQVLLDAIKQRRDGSKDGHTELELDKLGARALAADSIEINTVARRMTTRNLVQTDRKIDTVNTERWEISLMTTTRHYRDENGLVFIESLSKLRLDTRRSSHSHGPGLSVLVSFGRSHIDRSFISPVVFAYRCVSNDSDVFGLIKKDDLEGLKMLLAEGKATLRDCNENNTSLLSFATFFTSMECFKFLISKGADLDRLDLDPQDGWLRTPLGMSSTQRYNGDGTSIGYAEHSRITLPFRKLLLEAAADPTVTPPSWKEFDLPQMPLAQALIDPNVSAGSTASLDALLSRGGIFVDMRNTKIDGRSVWLWVCEQTTCLQTPLLLQRLLDAGCDADEVDEIGQNGLFACVLNASNPDTSKDMMILRLLIHVAKISPFVRDTFGRSIFDYVENGNFPNQPRNNFSQREVGSYRRDLWYSTLVRSGFHIRTISPLLPHATMHYTPEHFRALWQLNHWNRRNFRSQMDDLLQRFPFNGYEAREMFYAMEARRERVMAQDPACKYLYPDEGCDYLDDDGFHEWTGEALPVKHWWDVSEEEHQRLTTQQLVLLN